LGHKSRGGRAHHEAEQVTRRRSREAKTKADRQNESASCFFCIFFCTPWNDACLIHGHRHADRSFSRTCHEKPDHAGCSACGQHGRRCQKCTLRWHKLLSVVASLWSVVAAAPFMPGPFLAPNLKSLHVAPFKRWSRLRSCVAKNQLGVARTIDCRPLRRLQLGNALLPLVARPLFLCQLGSS
jgi:hypothetical protein